MIKKIKASLAIFFGLVTLTILLPVSALAGPGTIGGSGDGDNLQDFDEVTRGLLNQVNPLRIGDSTKSLQLSKPGGIITEILNFAFPLAFILLFIMIVWGGFEVVSEAATKKSIDAGRQRIQAAIIGFIILFSSYWIVKILETMFEVNIISY